MRNLLLVLLTMMLFSCKKTEVYSKEEVNNLKGGDIIYVNEGYKIEKYTVLKNVKERHIIEAESAKYVHYKPTEILTYNEIQYGK